MRIKVCECVCVCVKPVVWMHRIAVECCRFSTITALFLCKKPEEKHLTERKRRWRDRALSGRQRKRGLTSDSAKLTEEQKKKDRVE